MNDTQVRRFFIEAVACGVGYAVDTTLFHTLCSVFIPT